jgi:curved DNA-binding protein CbpA
LADHKGYYAILGVSERANQLEIKRAYRRLARKYHPDRNGTAHAEDLIKKINAAYEVLSDVNKREQYDKSSFGEVGHQQEWQQEAQYEQQQQQQQQEEETTPMHEQYQEHYNGQDHTEQQQQSQQETQQSSRAKRTEAKRDTTDFYYGPTYIDTPKSRFHIIVEPSLCMAFGSCETLAPKVFVVEKNKRVNPKATVQSEAEADYETIHAAAQMCPTKAIKIIDRYTGEQLFP